MTYHELEQQVLQLPAAERETLAVRLLSSLDEVAPGAIDPEWVEEIERRYLKYKSGATQAAPARVAIQRIRERHGWT